VLPPGEPNRHHSAASLAVAFRQFFLDRLGMAMWIPPLVLAGNAATPLLGAQIFKWDTANYHRFILFSGSI
jgi:hypothetical protein